MNTLRGISVSPPTRTVIPVTTIGNQVLRAFPGYLLASQLEARQPREAPARPRQQHGHFWRAAASADARLPRHGPLHDSISSGHVTVKSGRWCVCFLLVLFLLFFLWCILLGY